MEDGVFHGNILSCCEGYPVFALDIAVFMDVIVCPKADVLPQDVSQVHQVFSFHDDGVPQKGPLVFHVFFRIHGEGVSAHQTAVIREAEARRFQVYPGIQDGIGPAAYGDSSIFQPYHVTGKGRHLLFGQGDAGGQVELFGIGKAIVHKGFVFFFSIVIAVQPVPPGKVYNLVSD